jgi:hypothetical protein
MFTITNIYKCSGTSVNYWVIEGGLRCCANALDTYLSGQFVGNRRYLSANTLGAFNQANIFCNGTNEVTFMRVNGTNASNAVVLAPTPSMDFGSLQICDTPDEHCSYTVKAD